jgi:aryl-alcohol dehydrogenase-like predicted oxidoreductase
MQVSTVGLGSWLTYGGSVEEATARACMRRAYELGVTFFDTANVYARGGAEEVVGRAIKDFARDSIVLATKVYFPMGDGPNDAGLSRKHIRMQIDASLRRLDVEYVDLYQCHRYDQDTPLDETCGAMNDLVRAGKILYWGVSEWNADQITAACTLAAERGWAIPISNQPQYSALWRNVQRDVFPACREFGLGNVVWSPLAAGMMADYFTQPVLDAVQRIKPLAERAGCTMAQLALAWCLRDTIVSAVIVGATRPEQVDDNVAAADLQIDPAIFQQMDQILTPLAPG